MHLAPRQGVSGSICHNAPHDLMVQRRVQMMKGDGVTHNMRSQLGKVSENLQPILKSKQIGNEKLSLLDKMNFIWLKILSQKNFRARKSKQRLQSWVQRLFSSRICLRILPLSLGFISLAKFFHLSHHYLKNTFKLEKLTWVF